MPFLDELQARISGFSGFIRNIDVEQKAFIILTPVPYENLLQVNALLRGSIDAPFDLVHDVRILSFRMSYLLFPSKNTKIALFGNWRLCFPFHLVSLRFKSDQFSFEESVID